MDERIRRRAWGLAKEVRNRVPRSGRLPSRALFILGSQRSGTTLLVDTLDRDWRVKTFGEFSGVNRSAAGRRPWSVRSESRYSIRMKPLDEVAAKLERCPYPLVVLKPLVESQKAPAILRMIDRAVCVWVFRHYRDVARSNVKLFTPEVTRFNLEPMVREKSDNWRGELVPEDVRDLIARHYSPDMNPFDGGALFWFARNRLFFDLELASEERVMPLKYEDLVTDPERSLRRLYRHAGIVFPGRGIAEGIHPSSIGLGRELELSAEIERACEQLWSELNAAYESRLAVT
jgi:sulfotransferase family protein